MNDSKDISKQPLVIWQGQLVITTAQLAEAYGTTKKNISNNFNRNEERFEKGKHYFLLQGEELKEFMRVSSESGLPSSTSIAYLWTRRGASRHCKILGTDKAWEQFDYLEENYFDRQNNKQQTPLTLQRQIQIIAQGTAELYERVEKVDNKVNGIKAEIEALKDDLPILPVEAEKITSAVKAKGVHVMGGKSSNAYANRSIVSAVYRDIYRQIYRNFGVKSYRALKRSQTDKVISIIAAYEPPVILQDRIDSENAQQTFSL